MTEQAKKSVQRSPNYPMQSLEWGVNAALSLLEKEGLHAMPADIVAKNLGYKDSTNGRARRVLANLKAFGLIEKAAGGKLSVNQDVQRYKLIPSESEKNIYLKQWLKKPLLYKKILEKYEESLPSDAVLLFELVDEHAFTEAAAEQAIKVFRASLDFVNYKAGTSADLNDDVNEDDFDDEDGDSIDEPESKNKLPPPPPPPASLSMGTGVRYPIRLAGGRMAWIEVPEKFYEVDKNKIKAQLEVIGTEDEDNDFGDMEL